MESRHETTSSTNVKGEVEQNLGRNVEMQASMYNERDGAILSFIAEEDLTAFTLDGLRRRTGTHPETLSRILDRLEERGMIKAEANGYRVTTKPDALTGIHPIGTASSRVPLLTTLLPYDVSVKEMVSALKGRWFGRLRWVGYSESEEASTLKWVTEDGKVQIDARFSSGELSVEAKTREGSNLSNAVRAAHELVGYVSRMYANPRLGRVPGKHAFRAYFMLS